jgi:predicted nucleic acid-binding protein
MRGQQMPPDQALQHWEDATGLIDELLDDTTLMPQAMSLAARYEHTVYDMLYIAAGGAAAHVGQKAQSVDFANRSANGG